MSTSDQDQDRDQREGQDRGTDTPIAEAAAARATVAKPAEDAYDVEETGTDTEAAPEAGADLEAGAGADPETGKRLTPRQARRLRIVLSSVGMVAMGVVLALRIASRSSVLVVGVYGLALILCGLVIELSRNGRTRLGSWLLGAGLVAAVGADWLLLP
ncbi:hypothetical protein AB0J03_09680 [Streptomyces microflavus]|uniref:hypothetical protein n=1 Tax=Streptomyces microflavus TaxID=1919 RepID=UPI0033D32BB8